MRNLALVIGSFLLMCRFPVMADYMECGTHLISDDEETGQTKSEVKEKCGEPTEVQGGDWYYQRADGSSYQLHFNDDGQLETITAQ